VARVRRTLEVGGFACAGLASPFLKAPPRDEVHWDTLGRALEVADALGAPTLRIFSGLRGHPDPDPGWLAETLARAVELATGSGVALALEIEHECLVATRTDAAAALVPGLGLVWDPGNEAMFLGTAPDPDGHEPVAAAIRHVHAKDATAAGEWVAPGAGLVDWTGELQRLAEHGYDGYVSVETHHALGGDRGAATRAAIAALRRLAPEPEVALA
jgi:sugar phosphate isomerase/epimerase